MMPKNILRKFHPPKFFKEKFKRVNLVEQCKDYNLPLWQCPQFFFLITGLITIVIILAGYTIGTRVFENPLAAAWLVVGVAGALLVVNFALSRAFGKVAEANRMKSEFIRVVSHQLRSPLTNIKWASEFLSSPEMEKDSRKKRKYFKILEENIVRTQELISKLLVASRIEAGTLAFGLEEFCLSDLVKDVISKFRPAAEASNVDVSLAVDSNLPKVLGDPSQIKTVIENLLDNAIRYTRSGAETPKESKHPTGQAEGEKGKVSTRIFKKGNFLCFEIKDNGMGIPESDQKYIFQRFFRGEKVFKHQTLGSGLGLYISRSIIEKSRGEMGFNSKPDQGSTFWFTLPIK